MTGGPSSLLGVACRFRLRLADWRDVEQFGLKELASSKTAPTIIELADVSASTDRILQLLEAAITADGGTIPHSAAAAEVVAMQISGEIVAGEVEPGAGARALWRLARQVPAVEPQLRVFIGLASEWDDDIPNRIAYEADIVAAARELSASSTRTG